jgi:hypothetical protein
MEVSNADATAAKAEGTPATLPASTTTWAGLACSFFGSILFIAGALGFLLSTTAYVQSWLGPFQLGAFAWILGSLSYLAPLLAKAAETSCGTSKDAKASGTPDSDRRPRHPDRQCPWTLGEAGSALCLLAFVAGCSIVFFGPAGIADEVQVANNLPAMNGLFTVGSAILLANPLYFLLVSRQWHVLLTLSPGGAAGAAGAAAVDWWFELVVAASFTYAGAAGGYGADHDTITSGMAMWVVGSLVLLLQAFYVLAVKRGVVVVETNHDQDSKQTSDDDSCEGSDQGTCDMDSCV